ncbi:MAG: transcriptional repressor [Proteobacteria bacterium]|nr:transcriptional repressor [Pseudomonadota bacterium]MBU1709144.1 transcriptional repressor [Pseudomonadota bacterium]
MIDMQKMRMTKQRQLILEELQKVTSHPTADEIYHMVRRKMPKISLGTVYRNLEILSSCGVIWKVSVGGTQKRFDGNINPHSHVRCGSCGRVDDVHIKPEKSVNLQAQLLTDYKIIGHHVEFLGICPQCNHSGKEKMS